jgi:hypothetical protein
MVVWLIFFFAFTDAVMKFSFFNKFTSFIIGLGITVILANVSFFYRFFYWIMGAFSVLAGLSIVASLFSVFIVAFGINWGMSGLAEMIVRRRMMYEAATGKTKTEAEGKELSGLISALKEMKNAMKS